MEYLERHKLVSEAFDWNHNGLHLLDEQVGLTFFPHAAVSQLQSMDNQLLHSLREKAGISSTDENIQENLTFFCPVFTPLKKKSAAVIILLHGLNERMWDKYYAWGHYLCEHTQKNVVLFPIAYHINRSPKSWSAPRQMMPLMTERKARFQENLRLSSFMNSALSSRLTEAPERFFLSGLQTAYDLIDLIHQIKSGTHSYFSSPSSVDYFGYSIGGFLAQILFLSNPMGICNNSRLFLFCSGSLFEDMNGKSKMIMDNYAYDKLLSYYLDESANQEPGKKGFLSDFLRTNSLGKAFRSMISFNCLRTIRENAFESMHKQIKAIGVVGDKVIPAEKIQKALTLGGRSSLQLAEVAEFGDFFTHENPFPLKAEGEIQKLINQAFESTFRAASSFLSHESERSFNDV